MSDILLPRRRFLGGIAAGAGGLALAGCDALVENPAADRLIKSAEKLNLGAQRLITDRQALAREFPASAMSPSFRMNGSVNPKTPEYLAYLAGGFVDWRLAVGGLVAKPLQLSLAQLMAMPAREQVTRHDCVEGWSAIGKWRGTPLALVLREAGLSTRARYLVFHCADNLRGSDYYESIDLVDAFHPQTILAWSMNEQMLPVGHGAPLRLRVERQLGYKQAKFVMRIDAVESLAAIGKGKGGYWEDLLGYEWYAGI
jgi:DMSO/TMAO reductase YedYZ molybdopterin-dependent catalytic subunit